ncbi:MAG: VCBS repeat-containing protein [Planctomycetota bacterium]
MSVLRSAPLFLPAFLLLPALPLPAQVAGGVLETKFRIDGQPGQGFFCCLARLGDLDGDGSPEIGVSDPFASTGGLFRNGVALVFSSADGRLLLRVEGREDSARFGTALAGAGDVNGDGVEDLLVGAPTADPGHRVDAGSAFLVSGASGATIRRLNGSSHGGLFGFSVANAGDEDGDGIPDQVIGAPEATVGPFQVVGGMAAVFSGADGRKIREFDGLGDSQFVGHSIAGIGDVDADGVMDLAVGAPDVHLPGLRLAGSVFIYSGASGTLIWRFNGNSSEGLFGYRVSPAGDADADGFPDILIGTPFYPNAFPSSKGAVFLFSGATGAEIFRVEHDSAGEGFGSSIASAGDLNGDGHDDILVGASGDDPDGLLDAGSVFVYSGETGNLLFQYRGIRENDRVGSVLASFGDSDGDGLSDFLLVEPGTDTGGDPSLGSIFVVGFNPILQASSDVFSASAGGTILYSLRFPTVAGGDRYGILVSAAGTGPTRFHGLSVPLTPDFFFRRALRGRFPKQAVHFQGILDPSGKATARFRARPGALSAKLIGRTFHLAGIDRLLRFSSVPRTLTITP